MGDDRVSGEKRKAGELDGPQLQQAADDKRLRPNDQEQLDHNALHRIFRFLHLNEIAVCVMSVSKQWREAVGSMPTRNFAWYRSSSLTGLLQSPIR